MAETYRVLVTGSRGWIWAEAINEALSTLMFQHRSLIVVHGACPQGADQIADLWARVRYKAIKIERHPADWGRYRKTAGYRRNAEMVKLGADVCLAFILDGSKGASHCADLAQKAGIPVRRYERSSR